jgi:hypothetical protein
MIYQHAIFHGPTITGVNFVSMSEVSTSTLVGMVEATVLESMASRSHSTA